MLGKVKDAFKGKEPGRGGYGSEFVFTERPDGVLVQLEAEWAPRCSTPSALVTKIEGENVSFQFLQYNEPDGNERNRTVFNLCEWLADQASEG